MFENPAEFLIGNISATGAERLQYRDWSFGDFVSWTEGQGKHLSVADAQARFGIRYSDALEVKWSHHCAGDLRPGGWAGFGDKGGFTLGILVTGMFLIQFRKADDSPVTDVTLSERGDYVAWQSNLFDHTWESLEDSDFLTIRWWDSAHPKIRPPAV
jgi:hypothetical protein